MNNKQDENKFEYMNYFLDRLNTEEYYRSIDSDTFQTYTVVIEEVRRFKVEIAAADEDEALLFARINKTYKQHESQVIDTNYNIDILDGDNQHE